MTTSTAVEIGNHLAHLRDKAGLSQKVLAQKVTWSPAVLSRVESGERTLSKEEFTAILEAIGTEDALDFSETVGRVWHYIEKPVLGHPGEPLLWRTEEVLSDIYDLRQDPDIRHAFANRLEEYAKELVDTARNVGRNEHTIAFVGAIGIGKTTALCRISGLEVLKEGSGFPTPVLECGGGGVTVCEVRLAKGPGYGIIVEPRSADEIYREVLEFSKYLLPSQGTALDHELDGQDSLGTSKEIERAIRNMSGLGKERKRRSDGTRELLDHASALAADFNDPEGLATEILTKMKLPSRTRREIRFSDVSGKEPLPWLEEVFNRVNNGRHPEFSLPKRIDVLVPHRILGEEFLNIRLVDTKGIDRAAEREDLEAHFYDPNAVVVLCSAFNEAPSPSVQQLLTRAKNGRVRDLDGKAAVLVLPRPDEALAVKDDAGEPAESVEDGYELKGEQAKTQLVNMGIDHVAVEFFNAREDTPQRLTSFLLEMVHGLRDKHSERLETVINGAAALVQNFEQEQASTVQKHAADFLRAWLDNNSELEIVPSSLGRVLLQAIRKAPYASSVRASVNRQGEWHNLDCANHLAYGTRLMAFDAVGRKLADFKVVCQTILSDPGLAEAYPLIEQARRIFETGTDELLRDAQMFGRNAFTLYLKPDPILWARCEREWGGGPGYLDRVHQHHKEWFDSDRWNLNGRAQSLVERQWRAILERVSSVLQVD